MSRLYNRFPQYLLLYILDLASVEFPMILALVQTSLSILEQVQAVIADCPRDRPVLLK